ncbi:MAG TPA: DEAD/DEAH box helicase [Myxococcota bacterium]|nr:DEAD/DEAH box helicase [Myxococcota bacterium]
MSSAVSRAIFHPSHVRGLYAERELERPGPLDAAFSRLAGGATRLRSPRRSRLDWIEERVDRAGKDLEDASFSSLDEQTRDLRRRLRSAGFVDEAVLRAFALVREQGARVLGLRHYDSQLLGGWHLLAGRLVEMETGEGKTLTATLPAATGALAGVPVHVVSVNDYLTQRDAETMMPLYASLGLRVGCVVEGMESEARRSAYRADVTYVTNKQLAFDFLRDRLTLAGGREELRMRFETLTRRDSVAGRLLLRGLGYAIVDEADSILVDEARTPLILSAARDESEAMELYEQSLELAQALREGIDFRLSRSESRVELTGSGRRIASERAARWGGLWSGRRRREELVGQALLVLHVFRRDEQYLVRDGRIQVIDEYTGRVMADRAWGRGIQQMIEAKEGVDRTGVREPLARISYQRFFGRYLHLAGMTGTAAEVAGEVRETYGLRSTRIPTHRPLRRRDLGERVVASLAEKWEACVDRVVALRETGRPVLVGTRSVSASEALSEALRRRGVDHQVLTAKQDEGEAGIVARAGERGCVTVATNMAGRGTDIPLAEGVAELGGLAVLRTERHDAARIDRQLAGRSGRQGDPGSFEAILSLEDPLLETHGGALLARIARGPLAARLLEGRLGQGLARRVLRRAQRRAEALHRRLRREVLRADREIADTLAFSGRGE